MGPSGRAGARGLRRSAVAAMALLSCAALAVIALLVVGVVVVQLGPGGVLSSIRPGAPAPDFELAMIDGRIVHLSDYRGHPVALNFWATWCPACVQELPALADAAREHADDGLVVLAVNSGQWPADVESFLAEQGIEGLSVPLDVQRVVYRVYRVTALPTTVWIDADGIVRGVHLGALDAETIDEYATRLAPAPETAGS
jgi:peroxiredoxin